MKHLPLFLSVVALGGGACGKVEDKADAAPPIDTQPDTPPAPVKVTVLSTAGNGLPDTAVTVVASDRSNNALYDGPVNAEGKVEFMLPEGGTVSVIRVLTDTPTQYQALIESTTGVEPGDDLTFGVMRTATVTNGGGQTTMSATYTPVAGAGSHVFSTTCGNTFAGTTSPATLTFRDSCHGATFDLVGIATGGTLTAPRFIRLNGVNHENNGTFTIPGGFSTMSNFNVNLSNVADAVTNLIVQRASMIENVAVAAQSTSIADPPVGSSIATVPYPSTVGTRSDILVRWTRSDALGDQFHNVHTANLQSSFDMDLTRLQIPWFSVANSTATGAVWTQVIPGDMPDGDFLAWTGSWNEPARMVTVQHFVTQPHSTTGVTLPRLPAAHANVDALAQTVAVTPGFATVRIVNFDNLDGYKQFRTMPLTLILENSSISRMGAFVGMPFQRRLYDLSLMPMM